MADSPARAFLRLLREDAEVARAQDPAADSLLSVVLTYPGVHAVWHYRLAHAMWQSPLLRMPARMLSLASRLFTGVEIHPAARIGRRLFIDHGMGLVIGATAEVGDDCLLFHGVTLGGRTMNPGKRHPTLGDRVMVGSGAKVLGPLWIGDDAKIGANAVVTKDVPNGAVAIGVPAKNKVPAAQPPDPTSNGRSRSTPRTIEDPSQLIEYVI
ncbi:serine O-acetyltransferase [Isoptericola haloaureus]|uniref:Serine acetyltransferase n=1 Tax=Isoptericola haloaureus TaxID=1542902 RepID=A0ABU7Z6J5_9MICO